MNSSTGTMTVVRTSLIGNVAGGLAADEGGGALFNDGGSLSVSNSQLLNNAANGTSGSGGGILNNNGVLTVESSSIRGNSASRAGGGIEVNVGTTATNPVTASINLTTLRGNSTGANTGNGGGLHLTGAGQVTVSGSSVGGNTAAAEGGGLWNSATGTMVVSDTDVSGNTASGPAADQGGGLFSDGGSLRVQRSNVQDNVADGAAGSGGGILNNLGKLRLDNSTITGNTAVRAGGGVEANVGSTTVNRTTLSFNSTGTNPGNGGGLHLTGAGTVTVSRALVHGNTAAAEGGGLWNSSTGTMVVSGSSIRDNTAGGDLADQGGGGLFSDGGSLSVNDSEIRDNTADGDDGSGGGILNNLGTLSVANTLIQGNSSVRAGGGVEANVGNTSLSEVTLGNNDTGAKPGQRRRSTPDRRGHRHDRGQPGAFQLGDKRGWRSVELLHGHDDGDEHRHLRQHRPGRPAGLQRRRHLHPR